MDHNSTFSNISSHERVSFASTIGSPQRFNLLSTLKEEQEERQKLEKSNFDLKMKVFYLEESLKKMKDFKEPSMTVPDHIRAEITTYKLQIEEVNSELEQRNLLLIKSKNAIESLKAEIDRYRHEYRCSSDLEIKLKDIQTLSHDIEGDLRAQVNRLELQLKSKEDLLNRLEGEKTTAVAKANELEVNFNMVKDRLNETEKDRAILMEQFTQLQRNYSKVEDELTEVKAFSDIFKLQAQERSEESLSTEQQLHQLRMEKQKVEESYEKQVNNLRKTHEQEMEIEHTAHMETVTKLKENYHLEVQKLRTHLEQHAEEKHLTSTAEFAILQEKYMTTLTERDEELQRLKTFVDEERIRYEELQKLSDDYRMQVRQQAATIEELKSENMMKNGKVKELSDLKADLDNCQQKCLEFQQIIEEKDITIQQQTVALESIQSVVHDQEHALNDVRGEYQRLEIEGSKLIQQVDTAESHKREGEMVKKLHQSLQSEVFELNHRYTEQIKTVQELQNKDKQHEQEIEELQLKLTNEQQQVTRLKNEIMELYNLKKQQQLQQKNSDYALLEQKKLLDNKHKEINDLCEQQNKIKESLESQNQQEQQLRQACAVAHTAMARWDEELTNVLDGPSVNKLSRSSSAVNMGNGQKMNRLNSMKSNKSVKNLNRVSTNSRSNYPFQGGKSGIWLNNIMASERNLLRAESMADQYSVMKVNDVDDIFNEEAHSEKTFQHLIATVERVNFKLRRVQKLRIFLQQTNQIMLEKQNESFEEFEEKCTVLNERLEKSEGLIKMLKTQIEKEKELQYEFQDKQDREKRELIHFRDNALNQHKKQVGDLEAKINSMNQHLSLQRQTIEKLEQQLKSKSDELYQIKLEKTEKDEKLTTLKDQINSSKTSQLSNSEQLSRLEELRKMNLTLSEEKEMQNRLLNRLNADLDLAEVQLREKQDNLLQLQDQLKEKETQVFVLEQKLERFQRSGEKVRRSLGGSELSASVAAVETKIFNSPTPSQARTPSSYTPRSPHFSQQYHTPPPPSSYPIHVEPNFNQSWTEPRMTQYRSSGDLSGFKQSFRGSYDHSQNYSQASRFFLGKSSSNDYSNNRNPNNGESWYKLGDELSSLAKKLDNFEVK